MSAALLLIPYLLSAAITIWLGVHAWRRRSVQGAAQFAGLTLAETVWTLGYVGQLISTRLDTKLFWNNIQFLGAIAAPLLYLGFALEYDRLYLKEHHNTWKYLIPLSALLLGFVWSDSLHGLFRGQASLVPGNPFPVLVFTTGPGFSLYTIYAFSLIVLTTLILVARYINLPPLYRIQIAIVLSGVLVPWVVTVVTTLEWVPVKLHEVTPISFGISNLIIAWALFRYHLFEVLPVARDSLVENMQDGVLVLDSSLRIVDLNPAARAILGADVYQSVGKSIDEYLPVQAEWFHAMGAGGKLTKELNWQKDGRQWDYEAQVASLEHPRGNARLYLLTLRDNQERKEIESKLRQLAISDPLTGILNRRHLFLLAQKEIERANRQGHDLAVILFDVDHFKQVNDAFGHQIGDRMLQTLARSCMTELRGFDIFGRYGGEEFIAVLPETSASQAMYVAERLRRLVENIAIQNGRGQAHVTISLGVASLAGRTGWNLDQLLEQADRALYQAKEAGRNQVCA